MSIAIRNLQFSYGERAVLKDFNLSIEDNKTLCILGVSGCGKTTLLNCLGGLLPYGGEICGLPPRISYVFQEPNLIPSLTVRQNLEYVLGNTDKNVRNVLIQEALQQVELLEYASKYPRALSGGQRGRAALARAFVYPSSMILMDEPFTGLDIALKSRIITLFNKLLSANPKTVVYVTHSIDEALLLSDNVCVMDKQGRIVECMEIKLQKTQRNITSPELSSVRNRLLEIFIGFSVEQ